MPSYQLACVVDDAFSGVTEVVRGADLLRSTARQILLQRALGLARVTYFHTALLRDDAGVRLAKRPMHGCAGSSTARAGAGGGPEDVPSGRIRLILRGLWMAKLRRGNSTQILTV